MTNGRLEQHEARPLIHERENEWLPRPGLAHRVIKRLLDIILSFLALVIFAPIFGLIAFVIKITSPGPVFYRELRVGYHGKPFNIFKFRTMRIDVENATLDEYFKKIISHEVVGKGVYKLTADPRVTPIGRWLRKSSLDELPQFMNVLRGDMSLVGPRAAQPYEVDAYHSWQKMRLSCKPGITGLWQVKERYNSSFDEMVEIDIEYIKRASLFLDIRILLSTPTAVIRYSR